MSEPGTLIDLSENLLNVFNNNELLKDLGWSYENSNIQEVVSGLMHVDDSILFSKTFCVDCLSKGIAKLWPTDVGVSKEEEGPILRFLSTFIMAQEARLLVLPHNPNFEFAFGKQSAQKVARLGTFIESISTYSMFKNFMLSQVLVYNHICLGSIDNMQHIAWVLFREVMTLGWPQKWLSTCLRAIPLRYNSVFIQHVRFVGRTLKHNHWTECFNVSCFVESNNDQTPSLVSLSLLDCTMGDSWQSGWNGGAGKHYSDKGKGKGHGKGKGNGPHWNPQGFSPISPMPDAFTASYDLYPGSPQPMQAVFQEMQVELAARAEEKKQANLVNVMAQGMAKVFGGGIASSSTDLQPQQPQYVGKSPPFSMLRKLGRALMKKDSEASEPPVKEAKKGKKRKKSDSESSSDTPEWIKKIKKKAAKEKKSSEKDKKDKKAKKHKKLVLPVADEGSDAEPEITVELKQSLIDGLNLGDKLGMQELEGSDWKDKMIHAVELRPLKALAKANKVACTGSKKEIFDRIIENLFE